MLFEDMSGKRFALALMNAARSADPWGHPSPAMLAEANKRVLALTYARRAVVALLAIQLIVSGAILWRMHGRACPAPAAQGLSDTKVVPLNPVEIRAARSAPVWL